jgi:choline dehydrogenase-like flavoprotein
MSSRNPISRSISRTASSKRFSEYGNGRCRSEGNKHIEKDVLIAGAGPVGLVMAIELARYGVDVRIIDKGPSVPTNPRLWSSGAARSNCLRERAAAQVSSMPGTRLVPSTYRQMGNQWHVSASRDCRRYMAMAL